MKESRAERSLWRAERWLARLRDLTATATGNVADEDRLAIEDFTAAALGEVTEVLEKLKSELQEAHQRSGGDANAEKVARAFIHMWLAKKPELRGMLVVRHLDVHIEGRFSGRILQVTNKPDQPVHEWWTFPGVPEDQFQLLRSKKLLSEDELDSFNRYAKETPLCDVLAEGLKNVGELVRDVANEVASLTGEGSE